MPVIYLVEPNAKNLQNITTDLEKGLYKPAYVNFLSSLPRVLLEDFATQTATAGTSEMIAQLYDQYLNFTVSEPDLFSLGMQGEHTYWALNSATTSDAELDRVVDRIVSGLFSVVVTMGKCSFPASLPSRITELMCWQVLSPSSGAPKAQLLKWWPPALTGSSVIISSTRKTTSFPLLDQPLQRARPRLDLSSFCLTEMLI